MRQLWKIIVLTTLLVMPFGCSFLNRFGPEVDCEDLQNGAINACKDGIIASCSDGENVTFQVCDEEIDDVSASDICEAPWQFDGAFRCAPDGTGGAGGGGGGMGPGKVEIASVSVVSDDNDDGTLSPGETAMVEIYAKNVGAEPVTGVGASLSDWDEVNLTLVDCAARGTSGSYRSCTASCDCSQVTDAGKQDLGGGQTGSYPLLAIELKVAESAPLTPTEFVVRFVDAAGKQWDETFELPVLDPAANIHVGSWSITSDENDDAALTPGESVTVQIYAENQGAAQALGVSASLSSIPTHVALSDCAARGTSGSYRTCTSTCDCTNVSEGGKQDIDSAQTGSYPILEIQFKLSESAPLSPIVLPVVFDDAWGNSWQDTVTIEVVPTGADIAIDSWSITSDDNDDAQVSPGESAAIQIYAENLGTSDGLDLTASLTSWPTSVSITDCAARGTSGSYRTCTSACDCTNISEGGKQDISPNQSGNYPILEIDFTLSVAAPLGPASFNLQFEDDWGNTWTESFQVNVVATGANIQIASASLTDDSGNDGQLSPGETGTVQIYAQNIGTSDGLDLAAIATSSDVTITGCAARGTSGSYRTCSVCDCTGVSAGGKQDLNNGATGNYPILEIDFSLSGGAPISPVTFNLVFADEWNNSWNDSFQVTVVP